MLHLLVVLFVLQLISMHSTLLVVGEQKSKPLNDIHEGRADSAVGVCQVKAYHTDVASTCL